MACSYPLLSRQKSRSNAPPISTEIPLLKDKFRLQSNTVHKFQRELCHDDNFKLLLKTLLKELFTNKSEILPCKSVKPCKTQKTHGSITPEQEINPVQFPTLPRQRSNPPPPFPGTMNSQMPGGMLKLQFDWYITFEELLLLRGLLLSEPLDNIGYPRLSKQPKDVPFSHHVICQVTLTITHVSLVNNEYLLYLTYNTLRLWQKHLLWIPLHSKLYTHTTRLVHC